MQANSQEPSTINGLKIIGAGFGRTGALSLKAALEELGFAPCYHMVEVFNHPEHVALWADAAKGKPIDWSQLFGGYQSAVDWPTCAFYEQLMAAYPDAQVLLSVRDPESWYASVRSTIYRTGERPKGLPGIVKAAMFFVIGILRPQIRHFAEMVRAVVWKGTFDEKFEDKDYAIKVFKQNIEHVKKRVPPEKLLVYDVKEGWEPLCAFLGVEVPKDKPFPHLNDRATFQTRMRGGLFRTRLPQPTATKT